MEAKDLRINNIVGYEHLEEGVVKSHSTVVHIQHNSIGLGCLVEWIGVEIEGIKPIPLTEEWLVKFGFENNQSNNEWYDKGFFSVLNNGMSFCFIHCGNYININARPKYVHQLQNLYFALTGEELTLSE